MVAPGRRKNEINFMKARKSLNFIEVDRKESQPQLGRINSSKSLKRSKIMLRIVTGDVKLMSGGPSVFTILNLSTTILS